MHEYAEIEEALKKCEEKFSKAFQESPLVLTLTSAEDHRYLDVNCAFERVSGWDRNEVIGRTPFDIGIWAFPSERLDFVRRLLAGETIRDLEVRARMKNGELRTISGSAALIEVKGEQCILSLITDITQLKQAEEAKQAAERLSTFGRRLIQAHDQERAANARELHDHIDGLMLLSVELDHFRSNPPQSVAEFSQRIEDARERIEGLVKDVQKLSDRLHSSKLEYLGLTVAIDSYCKELSRQKEIEVDFAAEDLPEELPKEISLCLFHILQEALQNAIKHSASKHFQVSLSTESGKIHLAVRDLGIGFDPEAPLAQSGLGLTIMKERVKMVNGELSIESQRERGTTIRARVPLIPETKSASLVES
jgi:PAS domain S-box-containing protein